MFDPLDDGGGASAQRTELNGLALHQLAREGSIALLLFDDRLPVGGDHPGLGGIGYHVDKLDLIVLKASRSRLRGGEHNAGASLDVVILHVTTH
jgi:hypothetical protein